MVERICGRFSKRVMSLLLAVCMVISMSPPMMAAAVTDSGEPVVLSGFAELPEHIREQSVPIGTSSVELNLPSTLEATVYSVSEDTDTVPPVETPAPGTPAPPAEETDPTPPPSQPQDSGTVETPSPSAPEETSEPQTPKESAPPVDEAESADGSEPVTQVLAAYVESDVAVTVSGVTWQSDPLYDSDTAGTYLFTAVLPSGYTVEDGVAMPEITVVVGQAEQSAVDKVIAMIDALPTMDEWTAMDEPAARAVMDKILAAKKAYDALTAEEKALIDETRTAKLLELAEQMALIMPIAAAFKALPAPTVDTTNQEIFANGMEIKIEATDLDYNQRTNILYDKNGDGTIGDTEWLKIGDEEPTAEGYDLREYKVYGGKNGEAYTGNTKITHFGGNPGGYYNVNNIRDIYGGCKGADMLGDTETIITGGCPANIFGGGYKGKVTGDTHITLSDTGTAAGLFGGGNNDYDMSYPVSVDGSTYITVSSTVRVSGGNIGGIYGGGFFGAVTGNTNITVSGDTTSISGTGEITGGGLSGEIGGNTNITITGGTFNSIDGGCGPYDAYAGKYVKGTTNVTITSGSVGDLYGGYGVKNPPSGGNVTLGAGVEVRRNGIYIGAEHSGYKDGVDSFKIDPTLTGQDGCITVWLTSAPDEFVENAVIATNASASDVAKIELYMVSEAAWGKELYFDSNDNTIKIRTAPNPEETPAIVIDYANAKLTGFVDGAAYTINTADVTPEADGTLVIKEDPGDEWFGTDINIIRKARDADHSSSLPQKLEIPRRPQAPTPGASGETAPGAKDGKLLYLKPNTKYQISSDGGTNWIDKTAVKDGDGWDGAIFNIAPGTYIVRVAPTDSGFASLPSREVTVNGTPKTDISAKLTVTVSDWVYGDTAKTPIVAATGITLDQSKAVYTYSGTANDGTSLADSGTAPVKSGSYTVTAKYEDSTQVGSAVKSFTVAKAPLSITGGTVTSRGYIAGDKTATVTAVSFSGLKNSETPAITTDYTVSLAEFADENVGTNKPVTATVALTNSTVAANYTLTAAALNTTGTITQATDGTANPDYAAAKAALDAVHIITNVTLTLGDVTLPAGWSFTGDPATRLAGIEGQANQNFAIKYTSQNPNYPDVAIAAQAFPVTTVLMDVQSGLSMVTLNKDEVKDIAPVTVAVKGAPLPNSGDYAESNIGLFSALPKIATISGNVGAGQGAVNVTGVAKGLTMVGIAYKNTPTMMLGYILIQVNDPAASSQNNIEEIKDIGDTLERLIADPTQPTAVEQATVNAVASEITNLPDAAKEQLKVDDVKKIDALQQTVQNITVTPTLPVVAGAPTLASNFTVVGAAVASGAAANDTVTITATPKPVSGEIKMELDLAMTVGGGEQQLKSPLFFEMELPAGIDPAKLKISHILAGGSTEEVTFTASGQTISFKLDSFSGLQFIVSGTPTPPPSGGDGGSGGSSSDDGYDFWMQVKDKIEKADDGDVIKANAKDYDKMPESVMDALRKNDDVSLVITWNGKPITIPAGKAQKKEPGRIYWPLSLLAELYADIAEDTVLKPADGSNPETGGPGKYIPVTGGELITLEAHAPAVENAIPDATENTQTITPTQPKAITPPDAGFEADAFVGTPDAKAASTNTVKTFCLIDLISGGRTSFNCWWCWIALLSLIAVGTALVIKSRKKKTV